MAGNTNLNRAKKVKNDEFYTKLDDVEKELEHYTKHFKNKVIYCNCDNPEESNFFKYFTFNFKRLGIKKLITTHYNKSGKSYKLEVVRNISNFIKTPLKCDGDFRNDESIKILKKADIVVTNPPFSLFREYIAQLIQYNKQFLIIGSLTVTARKEIFKNLKDNKVWLGYNSPKEFLTPKREVKKFASVAWFTNIGIGKKHTDIVLHKKYSEEEYPKYDNYDAININKVKDIPMDYGGCMGVPITFITKYNPEQFELIEVAKASITVNGKSPYARIIVKNKGIKEKIEYTEAKRLVR